MNLLKCADCKSEISITSKVCPKCGSTKQFKGYTFIRKELVKEGISPMQMMTFQKNGGTVKVYNLNWKKIIKRTAIVLIVIIILGTYQKMQKIDYTQEDGTVIQITGFELEEIKRENKLQKRENELLSSLKKMKPFQYSYMEKLYEELANLRTKNKDYQEKYNYYKTINLNSFSCKSYVEKRDKESLKFQDSYNIIYGKENRQEGWTESNQFVYVYKYKAKNAFGMESTLTSSNKCFYDKGFNLVNVQKKN